jgi:hypothetical protein
MSRIVAERLAQSRNDLVEAFSPTIVPAQTELDGVGVVCHDDPSLSPHRVVAGSACWTVKRTDAGRCSNVGYPGLCWSPPYKYFRSVIEVEQIRLR